MTESTVPAVLSVKDWRTLQLLLLPSWTSLLKCCKLSGVHRRNNCTVERYGGRAPHSSTHADAALACCVVRRSLAARRSTSVFACPRTGNRCTSALSAGRHDRANHLREGRHAGKKQIVAQGERKAEHAGEEQGPEPKRATGKIKGQGAILFGGCPRVRSG